MAPMPSIVSVMLAFWPVIAMVAGIVVLYTIAHALGWVEGPLEARRRRRRRDDW